MWGFLAVLAAGWVGDWRVALVLGLALLAVADAVRRPRDCEVNVTVEPGKDPVDEAEQIAAGPPPPAPPARPAPRGRPWLVPTGRGRT